MTQLKERTQTVEQIIQTPRNRRKLYGWLAAASLLVAVPVGVVLMNGDGETTAAPVVAGPSQTEPIAQWATVEGLTGLSPASLDNAARTAVNPTIDMRMLATYAEDQGLTGLSPASIGAIPLPGVVDWAVGEGLSGLSPASLSTPSASESAALVEWAEAHNLSGLSPASLRPAGG